LTTTRAAMFDGPQGLANSGNSLRVCERLSNCVGKTPDVRPVKTADLANFAGLICSSLDFFAALAKAGMAISPPGFIGGVSEVYPGHIWQVLANSPPLPFLPNKKTIGGQLVRKRILEALGVTGLPELPTHDENDACVAALLAAAADGAVPGLTAKGIGVRLTIEPNGTLREGQMVIPDLTAQTRERVSKAIIDFKKWPVLARAPLPRPVVAPTPPMQLVLPPTPPQKSVLASTPPKQLVLPSTPPQQPVLAPAPPQQPALTRLIVFVLVIGAVLITFAISDSKKSITSQQPVMTPIPPQPPIPDKPTKTTPQLHIRIVDLAHSVIAGEDITLIAQAKPRTTCMIAYTTPGGKSSNARGLKAKPTGNFGTVTWTWTIGSGTSAGTARVKVTCGAESVKKSFVVQRR
jgi:hypothetical protein